MPEFLFLREHKKCFYKELLVCKKHIKHARMYALGQYKKKLDFLTISFRISVWENIKNFRSL